MNRRGFMAGLAALFALKQLPTRETPVVTSYPAPPKRNGLAHPRLVVFERPCGHHERATIGTSSILSEPNRADMLRKQVWYLHSKVASQRCDVCGQGPWLPTLVTMRSA